MDNSHTQRFLKTVLQLVKGVPWVECSSLALHNKRLT